LPDLTGPVCLEKREIRKNPMQLRETCRALKLKEEARVPREHRKNSI